MAVDGCLLHSATFDCGIGDVFTVSLRFHARDGWIAHYASGESLDAFELEHLGDSVAVVAMRDPEWLCQRFDLVVLDVEIDKTGNSPLMARYKALSKTRIEIQTTYAWTNQPTTEREADSPWFAVDLAMTS